MAHSPVLPSVASLHATELPSRNLTADRPGRASASEARVATTSSRWFYVRMTLVILAVVAVGFSNSERQRIGAGDTLAPLVVVHASLFFSWSVLFLTQTLLISTGHRDAHRRLGVAAAGVAIAMVSTAPPLALAAFRRGDLGLPGDRYTSLALMLGDIVMFGSFVALALYCRRRTETHKRLMLLGMLAMLPPAIVRLPFVDGRDLPTMIILTLLVATVPLRDRIATGTFHSVSLYGAIALLISAPMRIAIAQTQTWHRIVDWMAR